MSQRSGDATNKLIHSEAICSTTLLLSTNINDNVRAIKHTFTIIITIYLYKCYSLKNINTNGFMKNNKEECFIAKDRVPPNIDLFM